MDNKNNVMDIIIQNHSPLITFSPVRALKVEGPAKPKMGGVSSDDLDLDFLLGPPL